ncbi:hypothetical protein DOTSEDRAFT_72403 [Dothistroma septosporum NZE10]|uniref:Uncharacterized protein n=1 Tax=Dothistroma septosporum (strain NZE10 / CBS 128990) TaxID=675120 RepID=M2WLR2_DOTSN|nr:hypothetical protein DOTSEDRAFT_72403 [Dothistroma septosporum NZE10]
MRPCDCQGYREAHPEGGMEVEYLIHNLTGRGGEVTPGTRKTMTRRLHELSDCMKHQSPESMEESVRKTLEQLERAERFIEVARGVSPTRLPRMGISRPETSVVAFATVDGLPTPPGSTRSSLDSAGAVSSRISAGAVPSRIAAEEEHRPSTADQARTFWGVPSHPTPSPVKTRTRQDPLSPPPKHSYPPTRTTSLPPLHRCVTNPPNPIINQPTLPTEAAFHPLIKIRQLETENQRLRDELAQAYHRADTERDIAKAAQRAAKKWQGHYERYKAEVRAFFRQSQGVEDGDERQSEGQVEREVDDGYGSEE